MKRFFLIVAGLLAVTALVIMAVNFQNDVQYWLFAFKNGSPISILAFMYVLGVLSGTFLILAFTAKKVDTGDDDF